EAIEAEFIFWPSFKDGTEPDLVIVVGTYYLLIEAKYLSGFGEETKITKAQLVREIENGKLDAENYAKDFRLIAITGDPYYEENNFRVIPEAFLPHFTWTNWQSVSIFLNSVLESKKAIGKQERIFASDLCELLDRKKLRGFRSFDVLSNVPSLRVCPSIFFEARTAKFRGAFIGFADNLQGSVVAHLGNSQE
ncbi:unnamed protein product, partial [marine sediment metagenome]